MPKKWSQDLKYKNNVSIKERKEKIHKILTTSLISKLPRKKFPIRTLPLSMTTLISKLLSLLAIRDKTITNK